MLRYRWAIGWTAVAILMWTGTAKADEGRERLQSVQAAYQGLKALTCLVTVTTSTDATNATPFKADLAIRFPDRAAAACSDEGGTYRVVGGPNGRQIRPMAGAVTAETDSKPATIATVLRDARLESTILGRILLLNPLLDPKDVITDTGTATSEGGVIRRLLWKRQTAAGGLESITLEIREKDSLIRRAIVEMGSGATAYRRTEIYADVKADVNLPDSLFAIIPDAELDRTKPAKTAFTKPVKEAIPLEQRRQIFDVGALNPLDRPEIVHDFRLKNVLDRPLTIREIIPACGCTTALIGPVIPANPGGGESLLVPAGAAAQLPPGAETTVRVTLHPGGVRPGDFGKSVTIYADGAAQPIAQFILSGEILPAIGIPPAVDFGKPAPGIGASREIRIPIDRRLLGATAPRLKSDGTNVSAELLGKEAVKGDSSRVAYRYRVSLAPSAPLGQRRETLTLIPATDAPKSENNTAIWGVATTTANALVTGDVSSTPLSLSFGVVTWGQESALPLVVVYKSGKPDPKRKIVADSPHLRITPLKASGNSEAFTITIGKKPPAGDFHSTIRVTLANGQVLAIPVAAYVQAITNRPPTPFDDLAPPKAKGSEK